MIIIAVFLKDSYLWIKYSHETHGSVIRIQYTYTWIMNKIVTNLHIRTSFGGEFAMKYENILSGTQTICFFWLGKRLLQYHFLSQLVHHLFFGINIHSTFYMPAVVFVRVPVDVTKCININLKRRTTQFYKIFLQGEYFWEQHHRWKCKITFPE